MFIREHSLDVRSFLLVLGLILVVGLPVGAAERKIPVEAVKREFFSSLTPDQRLNLLEALDRGQQLTAQELGAKYRWGHVPPDRQPPFHLARWWQSLSRDEKQRQRLHWFEKNYQQLDLDRAARELDLQERLTRVYRRLRRNYDRPAREFEPISFPGRDLTFRDSGNDERVAGVFRPESDTEPPAVPSSEPSSDSSKPETDGSRDNATGEQNTTSRESSASPPPVTPEPSRAETDTGWKRVQRYEEGRVVYRREGNEISVVRRSRGEDTGWTSPSPESETRTETPSRAVEPEPPSTDKDTSVPRLRFPDPQLRRNESRGRRLRLPPVRSR